MGLKPIRLLLLAMLVAVTARDQEAAENQLVIFKEKTKNPVAVMTTSTGSPIEVKDTSTLNKRLIFNEFFMDSLTHFVRERIPERVVHAKGAGAFGYFEVTHDVTDICKAKLFSAVGKRTPVAVRFSPALEEKGGIDTGRQAVGFSVKFYTEDGNFDLVGQNIPAFFMKDPIENPSFIRAVKRNPVTNLRDPNMVWDYVTLHPETIFASMYVFGDSGIPNGYRFMPGFSIHTYQVVNECGENYFIRFHFLPDRGVKTLTSDAAKKIAGDDPDYAIRDLYDAIGNGTFPTWTLSFQVLSARDVNNAGFDVFDLTRTLPVSKYPLRPVGRLVLNKNPINYFAEVEQSAFCPGNLVPGILGAPDKVFEARRLVYRDAHNYRLGANVYNIPINCPLRTKAFTYNRDGLPPVDDNMRDIPNYYPNSFNGPIPYKDSDCGELVDIYQPPPDNFDLARELYTKGMTSGERKRMIDNIVDSLSKATGFLQERAVKLFATINSRLAERISVGLRNKTICG